MNWVPREVSFKFRFGYFTLYDRRLRALCLEEHFTALPSDPMSPEPPFSQFSAGVELLLARSHPVESRLPRLQSLPKALRYVPAHYLRYYVDLHGSFQDYLARFSSRTRSTLLRKVRRFSEFSGGTPVWREYRRAEEMPEFYRLARELSAKTYQEKLLDSGLPARAGFAATLSELAAEGRVQGYLLFAGERPIAYLLSPVRGGVALYEYVGFDPEFESWSPGTVLQYLVLERLFSEGETRIFDFAEGEGQHKQLFATHSVLCADLYFFPPSWKSRLLVGSHVATSRVADGASALLTRTGLKTRLKKWLRAA